MTTSVIVAIKSYQLSRESSSSSISETREPHQLDAFNLETLSSSTPILAHEDIPTNLAPLRLTPPYQSTYDLPLVVESLSAQWEEDILKIHFILQHKKSDKGNQQGRILVLARGSETLLAYPHGVFTLSGNENLLDLTQGEFFSVSRFREVKAEFGPITQHEKITEIEIILASKDGKILAHQKASLNPNKDPNKDPNSDKDASSSAPTSEEAP